MNRSDKSHGFTLIELMTVCTIIGILSAIAIPNFLNAAHRARVSRSQAELETIVWAMEMYSIDQDVYPKNVKKGAPSIGDLSPLTTPVPYLSTIPFDVFLAPSNFTKKDFIERERGGNPNYFYVNLLQTNDGQRVLLKPYKREGSANYVIYGLGPAFDTGYDPMVPGAFTPYNPSNGTISKGIIDAFAP